MNCSRARAHLGDHLEGDLSLPVRSQVDQHLAGCRSCAAELRELRATVALLRALPDPAPPEQLVARVLERIEAGETAAPRLSPVVRRLFDPRVAAPLAAGIAGLVLLSNFDRTPVSGPSEAEVAAQPAREPALRTERIIWVNTPQTLGTVSSPKLVAMESARSRFFRPEREVVSAGLFGRIDPDPQLLDLDGELNGALRNPLGFVRRVAAIDEPEREAALATLTARARHRGDAAAVAGRLRGTRDPRAMAIAAEFERDAHSAPHPFMGHTVGQPVRLEVTPVSHVR